MQTAGAQRLYHLMHKDKPFHDGWFTSWAKEPSRSHPFHFEDGVSIWVSSVDLTPDDNFLGQSVSVANEVDGDDAEPYGAAE